MKKNVNNLVFLLFFCITSNYAMEQKHKDQKLEVAITINSDFNDDNADLYTHVPEHDALYYNEGSLCTWGNLFTGIYVAGSGVASLASMGFAEYIAGNLGFNVTDIYILGLLAGGGTILGSTALWCTGKVCITSTCGNKKKIIYQQSY